MTDALSIHSVPDLCGIGSSAQAFVIERHIQTGVY